MTRWLRVLLHGALAPLTVVACGSGYPLPPTQCDDWCHATQRNHCREDRPADCVVACETSAAQRAGCDDEWSQLIACYDASPDSDFVCQEGTSQPNITVCASERQMVANCRNASATSCLRFCVHAAALCATVSAAACSESCHVDAPACNDLYNTYFDCLDRELTCEPMSDVCNDEAAQLNACVLARQ